MKNLKPAVPHLIAVVLFFIVTCVYFAPHFKGYSLQQSDMNTASGMAKETQDFLALEKTDTYWTNSAFGGMPVYQVAMTNKTNWLPIIEYTIFTRVFNYPIAFLVIAMLSCYILLLCFGISPWLALIGGLAYGLASINILYLAGGHVTKVHAIALMPGIIGGLIYAYRKNMYIGSALVGLFVCLHISANHIQETYYLLYLIAAIVAVEFYNFYKDKLLARFVKTSLVLLLAVILGVLPTLSNMLLTYDYGKYTTRGNSELTINATNTADKTEGLDRGYIKQYSLGHGEVWSMVVPNVKGASGYLGSDEKNMKNVSPEFKNYVANFSSYWGEQLFSGGAFYFGACLFLLCVLAMVFVRDRLKWAFFAASFLAIFVSMKYSAITDFFIDNVPLFSKFRDTKMALVLVQLAFPLLGFLFVKELFENKLDKKKLNYTLLITIGFFILLYILPTLFFNFFSTEEVGYFDKQIASYASNPDAVKQFDQFKSEIEAIRIAIFKSDMLRSIFFMSLIGLLVFLYNREKIAKKYFIAALGFLVVLDIWLVDKRYLNNNRENGDYRSWVKNETKLKAYAASTSDVAILKNELNQNPALANNISATVAKLKENNSYNEAYTNDELNLLALRFASNYRVFTLADPFSNASVSYYHKSIGGYHGAKLKRYQDLIDFRLGKEYNLIVEAFKSKNDTAIARVINSEIPTLSMLNTKYIQYNPDAAPLINSHALGAVWFINKIKLVENADAEILALDSLNPATTAVVDKKFENLLSKEIKADSTASILLKSYQPNHLIYESSATSKQTAIFSEIYYKDGWNAYIDGKPSDYFKANYVLRGITVPAGKHTIEFKFEPSIVTTSKNISYAGSVLLILFLIGASVLGYRSKTA